MTHAFLPAAFAVLAAAAPVGVHDAWFRMLPGGLPAGGYFTLHNPTAKTVTLTGASSPACHEIMLHRSMEMGGMASMEMVDSIPVAPGHDLVFAPGGYHLMCMMPSLKVDAKVPVPVTLTFADGAKLTVTFVVRGATGR